MSSIAVLYGTTADDNVRPVLCNDSGQLVTDQSGGTNWYENLYIGGAEGNPSISLLSDGTIETDGNVFSGSGNGYIRNYADGQFQLRYDGDLSNGGIQVVRGGDYSSERTVWIKADGSAEFDGSITVLGDVYARNFIPESRFDISKIGQALSTIHDVIESVDDLQGLKNLFHLLLDNLKSDPTPPEPPEPPE